MSKANQEIFGQRLADRRKSFGLTQKDLAAAVGVSVTSIQNYENGQVPRGEILVAIGGVLKCTAEWLVTGDDLWLEVVQGRAGREITAQHQKALPATPDAIASPQANMYNGKETLTCTDCEVTMVPMVEARLSAGNGSWETSDSSDRRYAFRSDFLRRKGNTQAMVLMRVAGDSMEPEVQDNDVVLIDTSNTTPRAGRLFAVAVEELVYLKKVNAEPGKLILTTANPAYGPMEIDARGDLQNGIRIIGRAVWIGRELD